MLAATIFAKYDLTGGVWGMDSIQNRVGTFHSKCGTGIVLSEGGRVASGEAFGNPFAFSNEPISIGMQFSVKILQEGRAWVNL